MPPAHLYALDEKRARTSIGVENKDCNQGETDDKAVCRAALSGNNERGATPVVYSEGISGDVGASDLRPRGRALAGIRVRGIRIGRRRGASNRRAKRNGCARPQDSGEGSGRRPGDNDDGCEMNTKITVKYMGFKPMSLMREYTFQVNEDGAD